MYAHRRLCKGASMSGGAASDVDQVTENGVTPMAYAGRPGEIFRIWLLNILLNICTLGVYSFWGRTRLRRYLTAQFSLSRDAFEYTGTGKELFLGFLIALPFFIGLALISFATQQTLENPFDDLIVVVVAVFLYNVGYYAALRYRLSRTVWRGIRGRLTGSAWGYGLRAFGFLLVNVLSIGLLIPMTDRALMAYRMQNIWFGDVQGRFGGSARDLYASHIWTLLLVLPTAGISRLWYLAALERFCFASFTVHRLGFRCSYTGGILLSQAFVNLLILIFTLGWGMAFVIHRNARIFAENIAVIGDIEGTAAVVRQSTETLGKSGEGLANVFDADVGIA
jgi:uncharacterized membrane protein YjgN (DUF898 family)